MENPLLNESLQEETTLSLVPDFQNVITLRQKKKSQLFFKEEDYIKDCPKCDGHLVKKKVAMEFSLVAPTIPSAITWKNLKKRNGANPFFFFYVV